MKVLRHASELQRGSRRVCLAIGMFDGVHLGHQQIIRQTIADAAAHEGIPVVLTFDRHPSTVVAPDRVPPLIYSLTQKLRTLASFGPEAALLVPFDVEFSRIAADDFVRSLVRDFGHLHSICVGSSFTFGYRRGGNVELLRKLGADLRFVVHGLSAVSLDGEVVSSTRIRDAIRYGRLELASEMLGRAYALAATVIKGDQLGHKLGFPTANLDTTGLVTPSPGVYAAHVDVTGQKHRALVNIGYRPTLGQPQPALRVETHLLDFSGNLYGQEVEICFAEKLREEQKFPSLEALKAQIAMDIVAARRIFEEDVS